MKDEKLKEVLAFTKDTEKIAEMFDNPEVVMDKLFSLTSESARLVMISELAKKIVEVKNDFTKAAFELEEQINDTNKILQDLYDQREELTEQVARQRILTSQMTNQLTTVSEMIRQNKLKPELVEKMLEKSRDIIIECSCCKQRRNGTLDEILNASPCEKCGDNAIWEIRQRILA